jgi:hypothetical protein
MRVVLHTWTRRVVGVEMRHQAMALLPIVADDSSLLYGCHPFWIPNLIHIEFSFSGIL